MANVAANDKIKSVAGTITAALEGSWPSVVIADDAGKASIKETRRAFGLALRTHLRQTGAISSGGRPKGPMAPRYDVANVERAIYFAFVSHAKGDPASLPLKHLIAATVIAMSVPFDQMDKAGKAVEQTIKASKRFAVATGKGFAASQVSLVGELSNPEKFAAWGVAPAAAPEAPQAAPAATEAAPQAAPDAAPEAPAATNGKPKKNKRPS